MRRNTGELQIFSLSFMDLLSCALGGILLLYLALLTQNKRQSEEYVQQLKATNERTTQALSQLAIAQAKNQSAEGLIESMRKAQNTLVGFEGKMKRVVFVFDHSGSMAQLTDRPKNFDDYRKLLEAYVTELPFDAFSVIIFGHEVHGFSSELVEASQSNREKAVGFIRQFHPDGKATETLSALERAFAFQNVDTIVLMTDGQPTTPTVAGNYDSLRPIPIEVVLQAVKQLNRSRGIIINAVAMGDYFKQERQDGHQAGLQFGRFLQLLSQENGGGSFIGQ